MITSTAKISKDVLLVKKNWIFAAIFKREVDAFLGLIQDRSILPLK